MFIDKTAGSVLSAAQEITTTANSTNVFDVTGAGAGVVPNLIGPNGTRIIGIDLGGSTGIASNQIVISNALTTAGTGAGTLTISLQAAPDNGSGAPGTYYTLDVQPAIAGTSIVAGWQTVILIPPIPVGAALPRFYRLVYTVSGTFAATLNANMAINNSTPRSATLYGRNFGSF
jgi:hypothetical protein